MINSLHKNNIYLNIIKVKTHMTNNPNYHEFINNIVDKLTIQARINNSCIDFNNSYYEHYFNNNNTFVNAYHE